MATADSDKATNPASTKKRHWMKRPTILRVLSQPGFSRLLLSEMLFDIGILARIAADSWLAYDITGSNLWVGIVAGARAVPKFLFPLFSGVIADRLNRRLLVSLTRYALALFCIVQAILIATGIMNQWHQVALAFLSGSTVAIGAPAFWALLSDSVEPGMLSRATASITFVTNTGEMVGPLLAGFLIAFAGAEYSFATVAVLYLISAFLILKVPLGGQQNTSAEEGKDGSSSYFQGIKEGLIYARKSPTLPWLFAMLTATSILGVAIFPLLPEYATKVFEVESFGFGLMTGVLGAGMAVGSAIIAITGMPRKTMPVILIAGLIWDCGMITFGFSRVFVLTLFVLFVMGVSAMYWVNAALSMFQRAAVGNMRGRVMSLYTMGMGIFPLGWAYGGALSSWIGNEWTLIISAMGGTPLVIAAMLASPGLRRS